MNETPQDTRKLVAELVLYKNIVKAIYSTLNITQLLNFVLDLMVSSVSAEVGTIILKEKDSFVPRASLGLNDKILKEIRTDGKNLLEWLIQQQEPVLIEDILGDGRFTSIHPESNHLHSLMCVPLLSQKNPVGLVVLANKSSGTDSSTVCFVKQELELVSNIVAQVAVVLENALLYEEIFNVKNYYENIMNSIPSGVITTDLAGRVITVNKGAEYILNISADRCVNQNVSHLFRGISDEKFDILRCIKDGENLINYELTVEKANGDTVVLGVSVSVLKNDRNRIIGSVINITDFTAKKFLENQVQRADQLAALGEMSAGLAHEIKNPLTSIRGFTQLLPKKMEDRDFLVRYVELVSRESKRLDDIVERFLAFARPRHPGKQTCNINDILLNTLSLVHYQVEKNTIHLAQKLSDIPAVEGDWQQLEQVFINIILNAIQMMDKDDRQIHLSTSSIVKKMVDNRYKQFVVVRITDNGPGIPQEKISKIFHPFYTTRKNGTGLGLSITNQIIEDHNGTIEVTSRIGEGTTFTIYLPAVENS